MRDPLTEPMVIPSSLGPRPTWAVRVLYLLEQMEEAAIAFVARYTPVRTAPWSGAKSGPEWMVPTMAMRALAPSRFMRS
ncbi:MAG: hypothetical protein KatS3mg115_0891 [Candidatus Poribacteria bacterium]|nr:MAG: hypothetical protein KatS3mg115_0891 [Candidatus Poribacteria bacterium]